MREQILKLYIKKKKIYLILAMAFVLGLVTNVGVVNAQMGMMGVGGENGDEHGESLNVVLDEIVSSQNKLSIDDLECDEISEEQLEELGEAVMSEMHSDMEIHERMDAMMGGEGSESLKLAHINMAMNYLGCGGAYTGGMMNMMRDEMGDNLKGGGYNMMGYGNLGANSSMMGYSGFSGPGIFWIVNGLLFTVLLVVLIRYFWNRGGNK